MRILCFNIFQLVSSHEGFWCGMGYGEGCKRGGFDMPHG